MDTSILITVALASALFVAVLVWKAIWLVRKIGEEPEDTGLADTDPADTDPREEIQ